MIDLAASANHLLSVMAAPPTAPRITGRPTVGHQIDQLRLVVERMDELYRALPDEPTWDDVDDLWAEAEEAESLASTIKNRVDEMAS